MRFGRYVGFVLVLAGCGDNDHPLGNNTSSIRCSSVVTFPSSIYVPTGYGASAVASADLDGDGHADLVTPDGFIGQVSVLLGNGDGTFRDFVDYPAGTAPAALAITDLDGDGKLDLIVGDASSAALLQLRGNGDGTFLPAEVLVTLSAAPSAITIHDVNEDGRADVIVRSAPGVVVLVNGSGGALQITGEYAVDWGGGVAVGDLDGDGQVDLVAAQASSVDKISIFRGNGDGTFQPRVDQNIGQGPFFVSLVDLDRDGKLDLILGNTLTNSVTVARGNGDATFSAPSDIVLNTWSNAPPSSLSVIDVTGDGNLDLVATSAESLNVVPGNGDGTFAARIDATLGLLGPASSLVEDLDGDGNLDAVVSYYSGLIAVLPGSHGGIFPSAQQFTTPGGGDNDLIALGDLDEDGIPDLVQSTTTGASISHGNGDGSFATPQPLAAAGAGAIAVIDLDGDKHLDVIAVTGHTLTTLRGTGDGTFTATGSNELGTYANALAVADLDNDHRLDAVVADAQMGTVRILLGHGDGTFDDVSATYDAGGLARAVAVADLDRDGKLDIVIANQTVLRVLPGKGDGTFGAPIDIDVGAASSPFDVAAVDMNHDDIPDLVVATPGIGSVSVLLNRGDGTFLPRVDVPAGVDPIHLVISRVTAADHPAVLALDNMNSSLRLFVATGDGHLMLAAEYGAPVGASSLAVGDVDQDSLPDLVIAGVLDGLVIHGHCNSSD